MEFSKKKSPFFAQWLISKLGYYEKNFALKDALAEEYLEILEIHGVFKAWVWYWFHTCEILFQYIKSVIYWSFIMFKNYLKVAFRNFRRQKSFSLIIFAIRFFLSGVRRFPSIGLRWRIGGRPELSSTHR